MMYSNGNNSRSTVTAIALLAALVISFTACDYEPPTTVSTSSSSGTGGGGGAGGSGGGSTCDPAQCGQSTICQQFVCSNDACGTKAASQGTDCSKEVAGGTCDSGGTCAVCDGTAPASVALLAAGDNVGKIVRVLHVRNGIVIEANSTQDNAASALFPVCAVPVENDDQYAMLVEVVNGNATIDLTHTATVVGNVGLICLNAGDFDPSGPTKQKLLEKVLAGSPASIIPANTNPMMLVGNCAASKYALYVVKLAA